jgi:vacuolar-type H+-ATPase subunit F/Vma7
MSRLVVITCPELLPGFQLAGVEAYGVEDAQAAQELIDPWLEKGEVGLLAIDEGILNDMERTYIERLEAADQLPYLSIPGCVPMDPGTTRKHRIAEMIRRATGFQITFKGETSEVTES